MAHADAGDVRDRVVRRPIGSRPMTMPRSRARKPRPPSWDVLAPRGAAPLSSPGEPVPRSRCRGPSRGPGDRRTTAASGTAPAGAAAAPRRSSADRRGRGVPRPAGTRPPRERPTGPQRALDVPHRRSGRGPRTGVRRKRPVRGGPYPARTLGDGSTSRGGTTVPRRAGRVPGLRAGTAAAATSRSTLTSGRPTPPCPTSVSRSMTGSSPGTAATGWRGSGVARSMATPGSWTGGCARSRRGWTSSCSGGCRSRRSAMSRP